jgi:hypothetical protein
MQVKNPNTSKTNSLVFTIFDQIQGKLVRHFEQKKDLFQSKGCYSQIFAVMKLVEKSWNFDSKLLFYRYLQL